MIEIVIRVNIPGKRRLDMTLDDYIFGRGITLAQLADEIGYSRFTLYKVRNGNITPGKRLIYLIDKLTNGQVKIKYKKKGDK